MYELMANFDSRKSFYGKARVLEEGDRKTLISYNTKICTISGPGTFQKLWSGWSNTTARHINEFRQQAGLPAINKKQWHDLPM